MKLKINKTSIKESITKKNKDWSWNTNNNESQTVIFGKKREKKRKKRSTCDKLNCYRRLTSH